MTTKVIYYFLLCLYVVLMICLIRLSKICVNGKTVFPFISFPDCFCKQWKASTLFILHFFRLLPENTENKQIRVKDNVWCCSWSNAQLCAWTIIGEQKIFVKWMLTLNLLAFFVLNVTYFFLHLPLPLFFHP